MLNGDVSWCILVVNTTDGPKRSSAHIKDVRNYIIHRYCFVDRVRCEEDRVVQRMTRVKSEKKGVGTGR